MGLLDGLKGGQGFYWGTMPMPYEKMQRPDPIALPAGGRGSTTAASTAKPVEALSGDAANHERMKPLYEQADQIFMAEKMGEKVSPEQLKWANEVRVAKASNEAMLVKNNHNYNQRVESEAFRENLDQYMLDERGNRSLKEDGSGYITVADFYSDMNVKGGGVGDNLRIQPTKFSQLYNAKTFHDEVDEIFKQAEGHYNDSFTSRIGINSGIAFNNSEKQLLTRYSNRERTNELNLKYAEGMAMSRILSDKNMYGGMKQALFQAIDLNMTIPAGFFSAEKQKERKDDIKWSGDHAYIRANDDDLFEFMEYHLKNQTAIRMNNEIDGRFYDTVVSGGDGSNSNVSFPKLHEMFTNSKYVWGEGKHEIVDFGAIARGERVNFKQGIFTEIEGLDNVFRLAHETAIGKFNANEEQILVNWAKANGIELSDMNSNQKDIAKNNAIALLTKEEFLSTGQIQEYIKDEAEKEGKALKEKGTSSLSELFARAVMIRSGAITGDGIESINDAKSRSVREIETMNGYLADMSFNDFKKSSREVMYYKINNEKDLENTELSNGSMRLGSINRVQILGTEFTYKDLAVDGKKIIFADPLAAISNFPMGGDNVGAIKGSMIVPASSSYLKNLKLNTLDGEGNQVSIGDYSRKKLGIEKVKLSAELMEGLNMIASDGYAVNDWVYIIPTTLDATQIHNQALADTPGTHLKTRYDALEKEQNGYAEIMESIMGIGQ